MNSEHATTKKTTTPMSDDVFDNVVWMKDQTPQKKGRKTEKRLLMQRGARVHPNSGAGHIKDDGSDDDFIYEVKETAKRSFVLSVKELRSTYRRALRQGKLAVWLIHFPNEGFTAEVKLIPDSNKEALQ